MDANTLWEIVSAIYRGYANVFHQNAMLGVIFIALTFVGIFVVLAYLSVKLHSSIKTLGIVIFIIFMAVIITVIWKEWGIGIDLSNGILNATNVSNITANLTH